MDYIQEDLNLIRTASGDATDVTEKKEGKKKSIPKNQESLKSGKMEAVKDRKVSKKRTKTLSPGRIQKEIDTTDKKEKRGRRSISTSKPTLGKIKLPSMKKQQTSEPLTVTMTINNDKKMTPGTTRGRRSLDPTGIQPSIDDKPQISAPKEPAVSTKTIKSKPSSRSRKSIEPYAVPLEAIRFVDDKSQTSAPKEPAVSTKTVKSKPSSRSRKGIDPDAVPLEAIRFVEGARIEAVDNGQWYRARIVTVDEDKMDVLVHFDGWGARFDTWFPMTSALIRGRTQLDEKPEAVKFEEGEDVLGKWSDGNFYPATILKVMKTGSYNVMFFDGLKKSLRPSCLKKMTEEEKETAMQAAQKLLLLPPGITSPESSASVSSPVSDRRRYRTSANDREKRLTARAQDSKPARGVKRKAESLPNPSDHTSEKEVDNAEQKNVSDDEAFHAKRARLDKITTSLISRVSPTLEMKDKEDEATVSDAQEETTKSGDTEKKPTKRSDSSKEIASHRTGARGPGNKVLLKRVPGRRGRPPKPKPVVKNEQPEPKKVESEVAPKQSPKEQSASLPTSSSSIASMEVTTTQAKVTTTQAKLTTPQVKETTAQAKVTTAQAKVTTAQAKVTTAQAKVISTQAKVTSTQAKVTATQAEVTITQAKVNTPQANSESCTSPNQAEVEPEVAKPVSDDPSEESPGKSTKYKPGDIVLAKWADCRSYLAYIVQKEDDDSYKIRYYDGHVRVVKSSFIHPWIGPLPESLKKFKKKSKRTRRQRSKSIEIKRGKGRPAMKTTGIGRGLPISAQARRRTIATISTAKTESSNASTLSPQSRRRRRTESNESPADITDQYKAGERVLAKWTDLRWYPATVVKRVGVDHYEVMYADNMTKLVRDTWLSSWTPPVAGDSTKGKEKTEQKEEKTEDPEIQKTETEPSDMPRRNKKRGNNLLYAMIHDDSTKVESKLNWNIETVNQRNGGKRGEQTQAGNSPTKSEDTGGKFSVEFLPGRTVLAKYTNGRNYPATVKEKLVEGKYLVEYDNGVTHEVKFSSMKPWSTTALPPLKKKILRKLYQPKTADSLATPQIAELLKQEKSVRMVPQKSVQMPRQVVRGYDAYYARLPAQEGSAKDLHKYKCRVPGCTKAFRKEEMLRTHHKHYHQQRYKLRDQENQSIAGRKKPAKEEGTRRRVSSDYETVAKSQPEESKKTVDESQNMPKSRGAKPPMNIYQQQQGNLSSLTSPTSQSSSGADDHTTSDSDKVVKAVKVVEDVAMELEQNAEDTKQQKAREENKHPETDRKRKRKRTLSVEEKEKTPEDQRLVEERDNVEENAIEVEAADHVPINEDVIRCSCNLEEEEGFMIQCETCFTWQHAACVGVDQPDQRNGSNKKKGIENGNEMKKRSPKGPKISATSDGYICWVCKNPHNVRKGRKYHYNNDFLNKGKLPSLSNLSQTPVEKEVNPRMRVVSSLMDEVVKMQECIIGIKRKIKIASMPDNPLLKTLNGAATVKEEKQADDNKQASETGTGTNEPNASKAKSKTIGKKGRHSSSDVSEMEQKNDILNCKENLLDHIAELQTELDSRLLKLNEYVSKLSDEDEKKDCADADSLQEGLTDVQKLLSNC